MVHVCAQMLIVHAIMNFDRADCERDVLAWTSAITSAWDLKRKHGTEEGLSVVGAFPEGVNIGGPLHGMSSAPPGVFDEMSVSHALPDPTFDFRSQRGVRGGLTPPSSSSKFSSSSSSSPSMLGARSLAPAPMLRDSFRVDTERSRKDRAASLVQARVRGANARKLYSPKVRREQRAASVLQNRWRTHRAQSEYNSMRAEREAAATKIQMAYRRKEVRDRIYQRRIESDRATFLYSNRRAGGDGSMIPSSRTRSPERRIYSRIAGIGWGTGGTSGGGSMAMTQGIEDVQSDMQAMHQEDFTTDDVTTVSEAVFGNSTSTNVGMGGKLVQFIQDCGGMGFLIDRAMSKQNGGDETQGGGRGLMTTTAAKKSSAVADKTLQRHGMRRSSLVRTHLRSRKVKTSRLKHLCRWLDSLKIWKYMIEPDLLHMEM